MRINQINLQNHKSSPAFQQLINTVRTPLIVEAVTKVLAPIGDEVSPIMARAAKDNILIGEIEDELYLGVESGLGEKWTYVEDILKPEITETAETLVTKIKAAFDGLFKRVDDYPDFVADVKKYLNAPQSEG